MSDKEFILYLCQEVWNICSDGDDPDLEKISNELLARGFNPEDIFTY